VTCCHWPAGRRRPDTDTIDRNIRAQNGRLYQRAVRPVRCRPVAGQGRFPLSAKRRPSLFRQISALVRESDPADVYRTVGSFIERCYSLRCGTVDLLLNVAVFTLVSMCAVLALFLLRRPGALQVRMWGQFLLHGFPVAFLVNIIAALFYSGALARLSSGSTRRNLLVLLADALARMLLFTTLLALSFVMWALLHGAFAGSPSTALDAVAPSLRYGIVFQSLTGVYLYAMLLNAFPFFALFMLPIIAVNARLQSWLPALLRGRPIITAAAFFALWAGLTLSASYLLLGVISTSAIT
jgi:hypothetical protein